jgi:hypothetical protein
MNWAAVDVTSLAIAMASGKKYNIKKNVIGDGGFKIFQSRFELKLSEKFVTLLHDPNQ